ncbi:hypothetical protein NMS_1102 [Nonlabens marinus S1-08]|uniref:Uncharacterized protein n=1 Tax=Nonlabens marinus S1-08 TaxID=1454201 RepID=W8VZT0_9FLAO|nr:hypothetical protein NMS_1102 [Nonlabens marinus S1-08]
MMGVIFKLVIYWTKSCFSEIHAPESKNATEKEDVTQIGS